MRSGSVGCECQLAVHHNSQTTTPAEPPNPTPDIDIGLHNSHTSEERTDHICIIAYPSPDTNAQRGRDCHKNDPQIKNTNAPLQSNRSEDFL